MRPPMRRQSAVDGVELTEHRVRRERLRSRRVPTLDPHEQDLSFRSLALTDQKSPGLVDALRGSRVSEAKPPAYHARSRPRASNKVSLLGRARSPSFTLSQQLSG